LFQHRLNKVQRLANISKHRIFNPSAKNSTEIKTKMISSTDPTKKLGRVVADSYKTPAVSLIESSQIQILSVRKKERKIYRKGGNAMLLGNCT